MLQGAMKDGHMAAEIIAAADNPAPRNVQRLPNGYYGVKIVGPWPIL